MRFICNNTQCFNVDRITNFKVTATNIQGIENPAQAISINIVINDNTVLLAIPVSNILTDIDVTNINYEQLINFLCNSLLTTIRNTLKVSSEDVIIEEASLTSQLIELVKKVIPVNKEEQQ